MRLRASVWLAGGVIAVALLGCAAGRQPPPLTVYASEMEPALYLGEDLDPEALGVHIPDLAEAEARAEAEITNENADEVFERLRRAILAEWSEAERASGTTSQASPRD